MPFIADQDSQNVLYILGHLLSVMKEVTIDIEPKLANALIPILEESATRMTSSAAFIMADLTIRSLRLG